MSIKNTQNRNACIRARQTRNGKFRTETARRDENTTSFAVSTDPRNDRTSLYINFDSTHVRLSGAEARTLFRLLSKHYFYMGKTQ